MSIYMKKLLPKSNSSFLLTTGTAIKSQVLRLRDSTFLLDTGIGKPRICMQEDLTSTPPPHPSTPFSNNVEFLNPVAPESLIKKKILERFFVDLVTGESVVKERAAAKFNDMVGSMDVVPGEPLLNLPRRFRQKLAWKELTKIWRANRTVRGFVLDKGRGGYAVGIAGFITFLPYRRMKSRPKSSDRFVIERLNEKKSNIVVL